MRCAPGSMRVGKRCERFGAAASVGRSRHKDGDGILDPVQNPIPVATAPNAQSHSRRWTNRSAGDFLFTAFRTTISRISRDSLSS